MHRHWILFGTVSMAFAVMLGAFGAHALKTQLSGDLLEVYRTATSYHFYHSAGLIMLGITASISTDSRLFNWCGVLMAAGILLFSGSLYILAVSGIRWLGAITPFGGTAFILGWILFALAVWRSNVKDRTR